ncbi:MAG TPA: CDP-archaeol synthase [Gammaproteobacteria bacterium]|nr:CDP-archaeol synthase [Gammaproteobacteria bacterium]
MHELTILLLLGVANGVPILAGKMLGDTFSLPLDAGYQFAGKPLFGPSKTIRGILSALILTSLVAVMVSVPIHVGAIIAMLAMLGDLSSSFIKRRLNRPSSSMFLGLDQIPESLLPLLYYQYVFSLDFGQVVTVLFAFFALELLVSKILFVLKIRKQPY